MSRFKFIDLFCGIGAFHQAMTSLGGECVYACDIDKDVRTIYERNYGIKPDCDITKVDEKNIPHFDVLCAGFPCQSFSKAGNRLGFEAPTKGTLFFDVMRIARYCKPKYMLLENVRNLASHDNGNTWRTIKSSISQLGYYVQDNPVIFSPHYIGIPQHRERVFIMAVRDEEYDDFVFNPDNTRSCNIDSVLLDDNEILNLSRYKLSEKQIEWIDNWNEFIQNIDCCPGFPVWSDCFCSFDEQPFRNEFDTLPDWKQKFILSNIQLYENNKTFINKWLSKAKQNELFFGSKAKFEWQAGECEKPDIWDNIMQIRPSGLRVKTGTYFPALVAITQTSIIGKRKRYITPRECARIQSFPDTFIIDENDSKAYKQFGNSINVECAKIFAKYMFGDKATREEFSRKNQYPEEIISNTLF